jgi:hypothetical protein
LHYVDFTTATPEGQKAAWHKKSSVYLSPRKEAIYYLQKIIMKEKQGFVKLTIVESVIIGSGNTMQPIHSHNFLYIILQARSQKNTGVIRFP